MAYRSSLVSLAALGIALAGSAAFAQPATIPTPPNGQPGAPTVQSTTPLQELPAS